MNSWSFSKAFIESISKHNSKSTLPPPTTLFSSPLWTKTVGVEQYHYNWSIIKEYKYFYVPLFYENHHVASNKSTCTVHYFDVIIDRITDYSFVVWNSSME